MLYNRNPTGSRGDPQPLAGEGIRGRSVVLHRIAPFAGRERPVHAALLLLSAVVALAAPAPVLGGIQVWSGGAPRAKSLEAIARDPSNPSRMWVAAFGAGVYRSLDGGATWTGNRTGLVNTFVRCLAVQPNHPDSVFCGTNDGVFLSVNGGVDWSKVLSTNNSVRALAIHPIRTGVIYACTYGSGIYKSTNGGKNWSTINLGLVSTNVRDVALQPGKPDTLLAATGTGGGVHRSFNGGLSWAQVPDTTATTGAVEQIQWDRLAPGRVYAAMLEKGVIRSLDGGNTWVRINSGLTTFRARSLAVVDTVRYVGTDGAGVFVTTLNDTLWHPVGNGITAPIVDALSASAGSPSTCWAGTDGAGLFLSNNRGGSWVQLDGGLLNAFAFSLAVRPSSHVVYCGGGFGDQFWRSADQGGSWTRATRLVTHDSEHGVAPDPLAAQTVYLSAYGAGVYRSDDDGLTWFNPDSLAGTLANKFVRDLITVPGQTGHLFVGSGDGVYESTDGAQSWTRRANGLPASFSVRALALAPSSPVVMYAGSDSDTVFTSVDGGKNWSRSSTGLRTRFVHSLLVDASTPATVYAGSDSGVFKSLDGGGHWSPARTGLPSGAAGSARALAQDMAHPVAIFCGVYGGGVFQSQDGGANWQPVANQAGLADLHVRSLAVDGSAVSVYAGTEDGVFQLSSYPLPASTGVGPAGGGRLALAAWPVPAGARAVEVAFTLPRPGPASLEVYGITGERVRTLWAGVETEAGPHRASWDRRDDRGRTVAPGLYFLRLESGRLASTTRVVVTAR